MPSYNDIQALATVTSRDDLLPKLPLVLEASRSRLKWQVLILGFAAGLATWGFIALPFAWPLLLVSVFFWLVTGLGIFAARRRMALRIDETGFCLVGALRQQSPIPWQYVRAIGVVSIGASTFISYQWSDHAPRRKVIGGMAIPITRYEGISIEAVAAILRIGCEAFGDSRSL